MVIGASPNPDRYSYMAVARLQSKNIEVVPVGLRTGEVMGIQILKGEPHIENVHTITLYMRAELQKPLYSYLFSLQPKRIIFNPGTENPELEELAHEKNIETLEACTLVMLSLGNY